MFIVIAMLLISGLGFKRDSPTTQHIQYLNTMQASIDNKPYKNITLPMDIYNLKPGTQVILKTIITPSTYDGVYIKTKYATAQVYLDNKLAFVFGRDVNYPNYMKDPTREIHIVETYGKSKPMELKIVYQSPNTTSTLELPVPMIGTSKELMLERSKKYGLAMIISITLILTGFALVLISLALMLIHRKGKLFFWLGTFSLTSGAWFFGSNDFAITIFPNSTTLYLISYIGFISFMPSLIHFISSGAEFTKPKPLKYLEYFTVSCGLIALLLQLTGVYPFHRSQVFFQILIIITLIYLIVYSFYEAHINKNYQVMSFIGPLCIATFTAIVDIILSFHNTVPLSFPPSLVGTIIFLLTMGFITSRTLKNSMEIDQKEKELAIEKKMLDIRTEEQRTNKIMLAQSEELISRQRHDLRHHLTAIRQLANADNTQLTEYLDTLISAIPKPNVRHCDNTVVNAIVSHFSNQCEHQNIDFTEKLVIPETEDYSMDNDLCVIFANLIENAMEACMRMDNDNRYIKITSKLQYNLLIIQMENSYDGNVIKEGNKFISSKRAQVGIGLESVKSLALQHHGSCQFNPSDDCFYSSVYLKIK